jgi:hypothetical protein
MDFEIKLTNPRIAEITTANLRIELAQEIATVMSGTRIAIAPVQELAVAMTNARRNIQQMLAPFQESVNFAVGAVKLVHDFQVNLQRGVEQWMAQQQLSWARIAEMMAIAAANFERYQNEEEPEACKLLADAGWLEMHRHFCLQHLRETVVVYKTQGEAAMNDAIVEYFNHDDCALLVEMSEGWMSVPYLGDRENIIRDAVEAHKHGKFTLSVPTLLPLVDGLSAEILGNQSMKAVALLANERRANDPEIWAQAFCDFVAHVYYKGYEFGKENAPFLSRHGILHGRVFDYPSVLNSTRVFLFIDVIANIWHDTQKAVAPTTIQ